jgi:outer membrane biosynthesis protein TonB
MPRFDFGPALGQVRLPMASVTLSAVLHAGAAVAIVVALATAAAPPKKPMIVQLVPAVAALGSPTGSPVAPPEETPRPEPVAPRAEPAPQLPTRVATPAPPKLAPLPAAVLPTRERPRETTPAVEPTPLPQRKLAAALPRFDQREMPALPAAKVAPAVNPLPSPLAAKPAAPDAAGPGASTPRALGRPDGSPKGAGMITVEGDFPWAWYIAAIQRKISEQWQDRARPGAQPTVVFEIGRDGQLTRASSSSRRRPATPATIARRSARSRPRNRFPRSLLTSSIPSCASTSASRT